MRNPLALLRREAPADPPTLETLVTSFQQQLQGVGFSPRLAERVWVANRCLQLNCQQIASMPLRFFGAYEPAWVANPDPNWYPNGIGDAVYAAVWSMYAWGDAFVYVTARYSNGLPSAWTVLDPEPISVTNRGGRRVYESGGRRLDENNVVQISRDPRGGLRGSSALRSYASHLWGILAASDLERVIMADGVPNTVLKSLRKLTSEQADALKSQWMTKRTGGLHGAPAILPPEIDIEKLSFSPADLLLLDAQQFDARVIASAFGVPAFMVNMPLEGGLTYQSPDMLGEHWWRFELLPASGRIARALSANMLPRGAFVEFDAQAVLAPSFKDQVDAWTALAKDGHVTRDELRAAVLKLPPMPEDEAIADLIQPPSAGASPAPLPSPSVVELRPAGVG